MNRALAMGLGALLAFGPAVPAAAASHIDFSGYYRIMYMSETNTGYGCEPASFTDSYFQDRLNLELSFRPTDEISVHWRLRGPGTYQRWGNQGGSRDAGLYTDFIYGEIRQDWGEVLIGRLSDDLDVYGLASLGYQPENIPVYTKVGPFDRAEVLDGFRYSYAWDSGLSLMAQYGKIDNNSQQGGQVGELADDGNNTINGHTDQDWDRYQLEAAYVWDGGGLALNLVYDRSAARSPIAGSGIPLSIIMTIPPGGAVLSNHYYKYEQWGLNPALMHSWGAFSVHFEGQAVWGRGRYVADPATNSGLNRRRYARRDAEAYGAYLDFDYNYGPGNLSLAAWWVSGSGLDAGYEPNGKSRSVANLVGGNFYPLLVAYNGLNSNPGGNRAPSRDGGRLTSAVTFANKAYDNYIFANHSGREGPPSAPHEYFANNNGVNLNPWDGSHNKSASNFQEDVVGRGGLANRTRTVSFNSGSDANHWAVALTGNHAFTDDISLHYGLAYLALNQPNYRIVNSAAFDGQAATVDYPAGTYGDFTYYSQKKDLGFEIDLGLSFQLLDNLKFTTAFGYMWNGEAYKQFKGYNHLDRDGDNDLSAGDGIQGVWADAEDSYVWFNSLTFEF